MSTEHNKQLYRRLVEEAFNQGNVDAVTELMAEDFVEHEQMGPDAGSGREAALGMMTMIRGAFPDLHVSIDSLIAEGDVIAARTTWRGTHQGEFMGVPASGKRVEFEAIDIVRFQDGRAAEHWGQTDAMGLMMQIGAMEPPA